MAFVTASAESAIIVGGVMGLENGLPVCRFWPKVLIMTTGVLMLESAAEMSLLDRGEPVWIVRLGCEVEMVEPGRIRAVTVCPRVRAWFRTCWPVRPVAPMRRRWGRGVVDGVDIVYLGR